MVHTYMYVHTVLLHCCKLCQIFEIRYSRKYWRELYLADCAKIVENRNWRILIWRFSRLHPQDYATLLRENKNWPILIWRSARNPPNLTPRQYFRLYGVTHSLTHDPTCMYICTALFHCSYSLCIIEYCFCLTRYCIC